MLRYKIFSLGIEGQHFKRRYSAVVYGRSWRLEMDKSVEMKENEKVVGT